MTTKTERTMDELIVRYPNTAEGRRTYALVAWARHRDGWRLVTAQRIGRECVVGFCRRAGVRL